MCATGRRQALGHIIARRELAAGIVLLGLKLPLDGLHLRPGQFLFLRPGPGLVPLLRRPFGIHAVDDDGLVWLLFEVKGEGTAVLAQRMVGEDLDVLYPLGSGFPINVHDTGRLLVAGGMGLPPIHFLACELRRRGLPFRLVYGARDATGLVLRDEIRALDPAAHLCTDDGSAALPGRVTEHLPELPPGSTIYAVGPEAMMRAVAAAARSTGQRCYVSLEEHMACGVGVCMGCVAQVQQPAAGSVKRICVEGPVFDVEELTWHSP